MDSRICPVTYGANKLKICSKDIIKQNLARNNKYFFFGAAEFVAKEWEAGCIPYFASVAKSYHCQIFIVVKCRIMDCFLSNAKIYHFSIGTKIFLVT